ncbi:hypothetical protein OIU77_019506 [Salix suchowensis]|uniref:Reverse transcriptase n=1 Tax=Salix suchowensis TaxID=1278906 RepID=A0ABQ9CID8_9ROSI|nr:hypothetical protein OIU77_019506 [Salix suchowensis]
MVQPENPPTLKLNLDITQAHMARDPKGKGISTDESNSGMETQHRKGNNRETYTSSQSREEVGDDESSVHADCQASARDEDTAWSPPVGLNTPKKQKLIQQWISKNSLNIVGLLETRIRPANMEAVETGLGLANWKFISNAHMAPLCRILVGWNMEKADISMVHSASQCLTCDALSLGDGSTVRITYVYGLNTPTSRCSLWNYLEEQKVLNNSIPWIILRDFNAILSTRDRHGGDPHWHVHMDDFPTSIGRAELIQIPSAGLHFTWHNGQKDEDTILRKLDWAFGNQSLLLKWPLIRATAQARSVSDHSLIIVSLAPPPPYRKARFKFLNTWIDDKA